MDAQALANALEPVWKIFGQLLDKYGMGVSACFIIIASIKHIFTVKKHIGKWLFPVLSLSIGVGYHLGVVVKSVIGGGPTPNGWVILDVILSGFGTGATASLFQMLLGWRIEQWIKSKFPKKQKEPSA